MVNSCVFIFATKYWPRADKCGNTEYGCCPLAGTYTTTRTKKIYNKYNCETWPLILI